MSSEIQPTASSAASPLPSAREIWKANIVSGCLVSLVALPLCLAIANASLFPPVAGVITAIIGGMLTPWISNSQLTIKGPAAGLIVIVAGCALSFGWTADDPEARMAAYRATLAVGVASGVLQVVFALFRTGIVSEMVPTTVVHGMLAAIGIIIISKQAHVLLGVTPKAKEPLHLLAELPHSILYEANPAIALIGVVCLVLLFSWQFVKHPTLKRIPAPLLVVGLSIVMASFFGLEASHEYQWSEKTYELSDKFLVPVPASLLGAITYPDFRALQTSNGLFWVMMFTLIGSLESILSAKAVDLLDPQNRRTNFDRDLLAVGLANTLAAAIGGLPMISEIVRSRANIDNGAQSRWSNFVHGACLLSCLVLLPSVLHRIPLAALAAMLVFTGTRLASPKEFMHMYRIGVDQLIVFVGTVVFVLATDLLVGIVVGACMELGLHLLRGISWRSLWTPNVQIVEGADNTLVKASDSAIFTTWIRLKKALTDLTPVHRVVLDLSATAIVDHTVMSKLTDLQRDWSHEGRELEITGLDNHRGTSSHPLSCRRRMNVPTTSM